ncbi:MAG TPA: Fur family transcriptional regulator [Clostridia bacterium]|nr:Fur family transcriptional regulator [Clostridia bacterium]
MLNSFMSTLEQYFGERGYKLTRQRRQILEVLSELNGRFISCSEAHKLLNNKSYGTGLSTVYRTFSILEEAGVLHKVNIDPDCTKYRFDKLAGSRNNMQLICTKCGRVIEDDEELLRIITDKILAEKNFMVRNKKIKLYGYCKDCITE